MSFGSQNKGLNIQIAKENKIQENINNKIVSVDKSNQKKESLNELKYSLSNKVKKESLNQEDKKSEKYSKPEYKDFLQNYLKSANINNIDLNANKDFKDTTKEILKTLKNNERTKLFLDAFQDYIKSQLESGKTSKDLQPILKDFRSTLNDFVSSGLLSQKDFSEYKSWLEGTEKTQNITTKQTPEKDGIKLDGDYDKIDDNKYLEIKNGIQSVIEKGENGAKDKKELTYADGCLSIKIEGNYCKEDTSNLEKQLHDIKNTPKREEKEIQKDIDSAESDTIKVQQLKSSGKKLSDYTKEEQQLVAKYIDKNNLSNLKTSEEVFVEVEKNLQTKLNSLIFEKNNLKNLSTKQEDLTQNIQKIKQKNQETDKEKGNLEDLERFSLKLLKEFYDSGYSKLFESGEQMKKIISEISDNRAMGGQDKLKIANFLNNPTQVPELNDSQFKEEMNIIKEGVRTIMGEGSEVFFGSNGFVGESVNLDHKSLKDYANKNPELKNSLLDEKGNLVSEKLTKDLFKRVFVGKGVFDKTGTVSEMGVNRVLTQKTIKTMVDREFLTSRNII